MIPAANETFELAKYLRSTDGSKRDRVTGLIPVPVPRELKTQPVLLKVSHEPRLQIRHLEAAVIGC